MLLIVTTTFKAHHVAKDTLIFTFFATFDFTSWSTGLELFIASYASHMTESREAFKIILSTKEMQVWV